MEDFVFFIKPIAFLILGCCGFYISLDMDARAVTDPKSFYTLFFVVSMMCFYLIKYLSTPILINMLLIYIGSWLGKKIGFAAIIYPFTLLALALTVIPTWITVCLGATGILMGFSMMISAGNSIYRGSASSHHDYDFFTKGIPFPYGYNYRAVSRKF